MKCCPENKIPDVCRTETPRFGGGAKRRARPESDGNASHHRSPWLAFPSDPAAHAGLRSRPAAEPIGVYLLRALRSIVSVRQTSGILFSGQHFMRPTERDQSRG